MTLCLLLALSALLLVAVQFDDFRPSCRRSTSSSQASNWIYLGVVLGVTKVIHEFGHGLTCKHFGGECHEMGVMLLVLHALPVLQRLGYLDAAQQVAPHLHRRRRHVHRAGHGVDRHLRLVVQPSRECSIRLP